MSRLTYNPVIMHLTAGLLFDMMVKDIGDNFISSKFQIVGMETSSIPLIVAIQQYALKYDVELNGFSIRKNRKNYGLFNLINGTPKTDEPFVMVDDLLNSGATFNACLDTCMYEFNIETAGACYSIVDISPNAVKDEDYNVFYNGEYIQVRSLFKKTEFNLEYDPEKYWFPYDCDKTFNKRPDYT
jgi:orotate phosphoribosyltransferase